METKEYGWDGSNGYSYLKRTKQRYASIQFSDVYKFGFRVRAYKVVKGKMFMGHTVNGCGKNVLIKIFKIRGEYEERKNSKQ